MNTAKDLKKFIAEKYSALKPTKFDIAKIGPRMYIYFIDHDNNLQREIVWQGPLPMVNELAILRKQLDTRVEEIMQKWNYANN
jgi:hypothetical protein